MFLLYFLTLNEFGSVFCSSVRFVLHGVSSEETEASLFKPISFDEVTHWYANVC